MPAAPLVLLVAPPGPGRKALAAVVKAQGLRLRTAGEPYEATARFVERPADLVLLSLTEFRPRDMAFLRTVRRRGPRCRIALLVPEGRREMARRALAEGADVWLPEPCHPEELTALLRLLLPRADSALDLAGSGRQAIRPLARELAHAVNNPLQVLQLVADDSEMPAQQAARLATAVGRISDVMRILERFTKMDRAKPTEGLLGAAVRDAVAVAEAQKLVRPVSPPPSDGPPVPFDARQIHHAVGVCLETLAALGEEKPLPLRSGVHRLNPRQGRVLGPAQRRAVRAGRFVEIAMKGRGVKIPGRAFDQLKEQILWNHEDTRRAHPGLAPVDFVAREHGGRLVTRPAQDGTVLGIVLAVP